MNDPHVQTLYYQVRHSDDIDYEKAAPLKYSHPKFDLCVDGGTTRFEMKEHYAEPQAARMVVEPFIESWQIAACLELGIGRFSLQYNKADVIDRQPSEGTYGCRLKPGKGHLQGYPVNLRYERRSYPSPPESFTASTEVKMMFDRLKAYKQNREPLASFAYWCLTVVEASVNKNKDAREAAAGRYAIDKKI